MPKWASRIWLKVKSVRVERLQDISEEDAVKEGIEPGPDGQGWKSYEIIQEGCHKGSEHPHSLVPNKLAITSFKELWEAINGKDSWQSNPYVWVIYFEVLSTTGKPDFLN